MVGRVGGDLVQPASVVLDGIEGFDGVVGGEDAPRTSRCG